MRFEKLDENKIRITLNREDLLKKDVDFHSFMANSIESQDLFYDCLKEAEKQIGFTTKNYSLRIEALAVSNGDFILTVTRSLPNNFRRTSKKKLNIKNKQVILDKPQAVYSFSTFDDYCDFVYFLKNNNYKINNIADLVLLYEYNDTYYLVFNNLNFYYPILKKFLYSLTEFGCFVNDSDIFIGVLLEKGKIIIKNNALKLSLKYFCI